MVVPVQQEVHANQTRREVFEKIFALCIGLGLGENPLVPRFPLHVDGDVLEALASFVHDTAAEDGAVFWRGARHGVDELVRPHHALLGRCEVQTVGKTSDTTMTSTAIERAMGCSPLASVSITASLLARSDR